jgi:HamA
MIEDEGDIASWFADHNTPEGSVEVRTHYLKDDDGVQLEEFMSRAIPTCYISETDLTARMNETPLSASEILQNKIPDSGSVMAGDFGEVLTLFYLGSERTESLKKLKKWRFKQDRKKAAPHSDVIIMHKASTEGPSTDDFVICAEAKLKSTASTFSPIEKSIEGYESDKTGRLARTLVWLKEKAIDHENSDSIAFVSRFTDELLETSFEKKYRAVAIIDLDFLDDELLKGLNLPNQSDEFEVVVLGIKGLKALYERSYSRAVTEVNNG